MASTSSSSRSSAGNRTFRSENLVAARIYFVNPSLPVPAELSDLRATLVSTEGLALMPLGAFLSQSPFDEILANSLQPGPEKARYEACISKARQCHPALNKQRFEAVESAWMDLNQNLLEVLVQDSAFDHSRDQDWDVEIRPQGSPISPIRCARPDRGFGFAPSDDDDDHLSRDTLRSLATDPRTRLLYSPQLSRELIFPFCVYEAKSAMGGTLGFAENQGAVGAATAAALLSELAKLSGANSATRPPIFLLASSGFNWSIHACISGVVNGIERYYIHVLMPTLDLRFPAQLFLFQVYLSRIRDYALSTIQPWIKEHLGRLRLQMGTH